MGRAIVNKTNLDNARIKNDTSTKEVINLNKKVFAKNQYEKVIDTTFSQLGVTTEPVITSSIESQLSAFFADYNQLFYDIPKTGEINSHEYLIKTSSEYINFTPINDDIQALIEEINILQQTNLELNQKLVNLVSSGSQI